MSNIQEQSDDQSIPAPPPIQIPNESSGNFMASPYPLTTPTPTPTSSFDIPHIVLEEEGVNEIEKVGHKRPLTSKVWESFKRQKINDTWKAQCIYCNKLLGGETRNGTKHLHVHLKSYPLKCASDIRQTFLKASRNSEGKSELSHAVFSNENAIKELACMIALHEYPLAIVEHIGFRRFVATLQPRFKMVSRNTIRKDIINIYQQEKSRKIKLLEENQSRIAITTDMWTSNQKRGYMVVTAHYLDGSWTLQSQILSFLYVPCPHTAEILSETLLDCLMYWNIDRKLSAITVDNCSTNDVMIDLLLGKLSSDSLWVEGSLIHMRCSAHILNLIVKDGLEIIGDGIERVRDSVAYWIATAKREEKFEETARQLKISVLKKLCLDCKTRWNSTYLMLDVALHYKDVFFRLKQRESRYRCLPLEEDWAMAKKICEKLVLFYEITEMFSGNKYPIANILFPKICEIKIALRSWLTCGNVVIEAIAASMLEKFDKYWSEVHGIMAIATVLDPRYKMQLVEFYFLEIYEDKTQEEMQKVVKLCYDLVERYHSKVNQNERNRHTSSYIPLMASSSSSSVNKVDFVNKFKSFLSSKGNTPVLKSELDTYLEESVVPIEAENNFDIFDWWKVTGIRFPILQMLAKDVFAIPISTVASESAFSTGGRVVSSHRSSLKPHTIEALMCLQDWLRTDLKGSLDNVSFFTLNDDVDADEENNSEIFFMSK